MIIFIDLKYRKNDQLQQSHCVNIPDSDQFNFVNIKRHFFLFEIVLYLTKFYTFFEITTLCVIYLCTQ